VEGDGAANAGERAQRSVVQEHQGEEAAARQGQPRRARSMEPEGGDADGQERCERSEARQRDARVAALETRRRRLARCSTVLEDGSRVVRRDSILCQLVALLVPPFAHGGRLTRDERARAR